MADIKVNQQIWDTITDAEKQQVVAHLQQHGVIQATDSVVADPNTAAPDMSAPLFHATIGDVIGIKTFGWGNPLCKITCDAAAAAAVVACTASGPLLAACLVAIEAARNACRDGC